MEAHLQGLEGELQSFQNVSNHHILTVFISHLIMVHFFLISIMLCLHHEEKNIAIIITTMNMITSNNITITITINITAIMKIHLVICMNLTQITHTIHCLLTQGRHFVKCPGILIYICSNSNHVSLNHSQIYIKSFLVYNSLFIGTIFVIKLCPLLYEFS